jgi:catechol 2,3-dioxygenase-like lactoylglutathione lyase family enzyme
MTDEMVSIRYIVDDVDQATDFYTDKFGFELGHNASPAFAKVVCGRLRLLLAGPKSSAGRPMPDGRRQQGRVKCEGCTKPTAAHLTRAPPHRASRPGP